MIASLLGDRPYAFLHGDCFKLMAGMTPGSFDLILGSPPYEDARTYGIGFKLKGQGWVDWMVEFFRLAVPLTRGLVVMVVGHGKTRDYRWSATPSLLEADLHRAGFHLRCPSMFVRHGICGSGGKDYFRYDHEWCVTVQNKEYALAGKRGKKMMLPWSNVTACGHPPVYGPGGAMSHRVSDGRRVDQWGGGPTAGGGQRRPDGSRQTKVRPGKSLHTKRDREGQMAKQSYNPPVLANPGTIIKCKVGGGLMGHPLACENEAPYPLTLAERFVLSFCPPGGVVLDPFSGSGTTAHACHVNRRRCVGIDTRKSQVELATKRLSSVTPFLSVKSDEDYERRMEAKRNPPARAADHDAEGQEPGLFDRVAGDPAGHPEEVG